MPPKTFRLSAAERRAWRALIAVVCPPDTAARGLTAPVLAHVETTLGAFARGQRAAVRAGMIAFDAGAVLVPPCGRRFAALPPAAARRYVAAWWRAPQPLRRSVIRLLKGLCVLAYYEQPAVWDALDYHPQAWIDRTAARRRARWGPAIARADAALRAPDPLVPPRVAPAPEPAAPRPAGRIHTGADFAGGTLECDVVVVGSGAGGGVMAAELGEGGLRVIVLEEGGYHPSSTFTAEATAMVRKLYRDGGGQTALGTPAISFAEGRCVGGSTTVNGGMCWRTPEAVLARWARDDGVDGLDPAAMAPYFARVERRVSAAPQDPDSIGRDQDLLRAGAERLGWGVLPNIRNQMHCGGCNNCVFGCPTDAKRSTLVSYLPRALAFGVDVYADCHVERIVWDGKRAAGVRGTVAAPDGGPGTPFHVRARRVVVAAGAIQTPALLLRSGVRAPSGAIGRHLTLHPNAALAALFDDPVIGWQGVHQAYQVRAFQDSGLIMAAVNLPPSLLAMGLGRYGADLAAVLDQYNHIVSAGVLVEDTGSGQVRLLPNGRPAAFYTLAERDAAHARARHRPARRGPLRRGRPRGDRALPRPARPAQRRRRAPSADRAHPAGLHGPEHGARHGHRAHGRRPHPPRLRLIWARLQHRRPDRGRRQPLPVAPRHQPDGDDHGPRHAQRRAPSRKCAAMTATPAPPARRPSRAFLRLARLRPRALEAILWRGEAPDTDALVRGEYRGMNLGAGARLLGLRKFLKGFLAAPDGTIRGYNRRVRQNAPAAPWIARPPAGPAGRYAWYAVHPPDPTSRDAAYLHALLLDYSQGANGRLSVASALRDYLVRVHPGRDDLLLGKAYLAVGPLRLPIGYFLLERAGG